VVRGKPHRTTIADQGAGRAPDLLNRDFTAKAPNRKWVTDFTYVRSWSGFVYVAFILDVYAQRIIAWHYQTTKTVDLVPIPLRMAIWERTGRVTPPRPAILYITRTPGLQYTAVKLTESLVLHGIQPSIGSAGDAYDALMECINGLYKTECIRTQVFHQGPYRTIGHVEYATAGWVDWYNNRRHSSIGMVPPAEHEQAYYAALNREPQPA